MPIPLPKVAVLEAAESQWQKQALQIECKLVKTMSVCACVLLGGIDHPDKSDVNAIFSQAARVLQ